jgi:hypothetical protein
MYSAWRQRRENRKEFKEAGIDRVREMVRRSNYYSSPTKMRNARKWVHEQDYFYQRIGLRVAILMAAIAATGLILKWNGDHQASIVPVNAPAPSEVSQPQSGPRPPTQSSK